MATGFECVHEYTDADNGITLTPRKVYTMLGIDRDANGTLWARLIETGSIPLQAFMFCFKDQRTGVEAYSSAEPVTALTPRARNTGRIPPNCAATKAERQR